jgi:membrane protease YdiL (CAAX protease family)
MSAAEISADERAAPPGVWKFIGTAIWGGLAFGAMSLAQILPLVIALWLYADPNLSDASVKAISERPEILAISVICGVPAALAVLWLAIRIKKRSFADYLALRWPTRRELVLALGLSVGVLAALDLFSYLAGKPVSPDFVLDTMRNAKATGLIWLVLIALCFAAPVAEEFIFRGFVYRGWAQSFLRRGGAIVLSSGLFAIVHLQYDAFYISGIVVIGLLLGYLRYRSNSTWLTVVMHGFYNFVAAMQALWSVS